MSGGAKETPYGKRSYAIASFGVRGGRHCLYLLQLQQLGLPLGFRSKVYWRGIITPHKYAEKHPRGANYVKKECTGQTH